MANNITKETRAESYRRRPTRATDILDVLGSREMTARQLAYEMGFLERNAVAPRLTELVREGRIEACGKVYDDFTNRKVAVYRRTKGE